MALSIMAVFLSWVSFKLSVTYKPFMLSAVMLNVVMLRVVAPNTAWVSLLLLLQKYFIECCVRPSVINARRQYFKTFYGRNKHYGTLNYYGANHLWPSLIFVHVRLGKKQLIMTNALAYSTGVLITAVRTFIVQPSGVDKWKLLTLIISRFFPSLTWTNIRLGNKWLAPQ